MKCIVQRVLSAQVDVEQKPISSITKGYLLYVCLETGDTFETIQKAAQKISQLRIFADENGKMNKSIIDVKAQILSISQFTLSWDGEKGNRPNFFKSMNPKEARSLFESFNQQLSRYGIEVKSGVFGANMKVRSTNDGPVTFSLVF